MRLELDHGLGDCSIRGDANIGRSGGIRAELIATRDHHVSFRERGQTRSAKTIEPSIPQ